MKLSFMKVRLKTKRFSDQSSFSPDKRSKEIMKGDKKWNFVQEDNSSE